jgi:molecular chaperone HscB
MTLPVLERPNTNNYFIFYGLDEVFDIDKAVLKNCYLDKSKLYHPDYYGDDSQAQNIAVASSSFNNIAYKTLSNDIRRAQYLVELKLNHGDDNIKLPQEFLMDMMDLNEMIDEADSASNTSIGEQIEKLKTEVLATIKSKATQALWLETQIAVLKWKYIERLEARMQL